MTKVNQLLAKAMSTSSEEEAIACLRMARKNGNAFDMVQSSSDYNGHSAKYWYDKAVVYYDKAKNGTSSRDYSKLWHLYLDTRNSADRLYREKLDLEGENCSLRVQVAKLKASKAKPIFIHTMIAALLGLCLLTFYFNSVSIH